MQQMLIFFFFIYKYLHILAYLPEITGYAGAYLAYPVAPPLDGTLSLIYLSFFLLRFAVELCKSFCQVCLMVMFGSKIENAMIT
jgi:hypothetical protein